MRARWTNKDDQMKNEGKGERRQTAGEEIANTVTHVIGSHLDSTGTVPV